LTAAPIKRTGPAQTIAPTVDQKKEDTMKHKWTTKYFFACLVLLAGVLTEPRVAFARPAQSQLPSVINEGAPKAIPGQYIVVFKPDDAQIASKAGTARQALLAAEETVKKLDGTVLFTYTSALIGFSAKLPPQALEAVRAMPEVAWIEADQTVSLQTIQKPAPTGLDRIDRWLLPLDNTYTYSETGLGVNVYVIDTGIRSTHLDLAPRVTGGQDFVGDGHGTDDCAGHGTHVAGVIGGQFYGVAKNVNLHPVRVLDCLGGGSLSAITMGVDWVTMNAVQPAVANASVGTTPTSPSLDTAVTNSIASGVTYVVAAGNSSTDACTFSPADVPTAITVGATDPTNDTKDSFSNIGTCLKLFAPGVNITSDWNTSDLATNTTSGTSEAAPHVAGVAARHLQTHPLDSPAAVWAAIHAADDVFPGTPGWGGVIALGAGSPNELLHWGSLSDGQKDGDPHIITVDGTHYDFQGAGEFVSLHDPDGLEIQTRQAPIATTFNPGPDAHDGLATCVSLNTAVAARVGKHRVTYEPNLSGVPDPSGLQLRVDGVLKTLGPTGLNLGDGGRIAKTSAPGGVEIDFPDQTALFLTPGWWASQSKWYLNVDVAHTPALEGTLGAIPQTSWLPALPDGTSMGQMPGPLHDRYIALYQKFADAWRVTDKTSLFDYAPGTSTDTFTMRSWPLEHPPCTIPGTKAVEPVSEHVAQRACQPITDDNTHKNCVFDVMVTGETGFAKTYLASQKALVGPTTTTTVHDHRNPTEVDETAKFTANVRAGNGVPTGTVQFTLDGNKSGPPVALDSRGQAEWKTSNLKPGKYKVAAIYIPSPGSEFLPSNSPDQEHTVTRED
jgi:Subtilase family/Bacterial Ig-like domain (group 3)/Peptidase inhibitor I9